MRSDLRRVALPRGLLARCNHGWRLRSLRPLVIAMTCALVALTPLSHADAACGSGGASGNFHETFQGSEYWATVPAGPGPWPLVVALHGDLGNPAGILSFWRAIAQQRGDFALVVPRVPSSSSSWWKMPDRPLNEAWLDDLLDHVTARHPIDGQRVYAWGFSGGACFLGYYAMKRQERIANVTAVGGGCYPASLPQVTPACKAPVHFLVGAEDFTLNDVENTVAFLTPYGNVVDFDVLPGVGHAYTEESGAPALDWMTTHTPTTCPRADTCSGIADAGVPPSVDGGARGAPEAGSGAVAPSGSAGSDERSPPNATRASESETPATGCTASGDSAGARSAGWLLAIAGFVGIRARARRRSSSAPP